MFEFTKPKMDRSSANVIRPDKGHNLVRILGGYGIRFTHFVPVIGLDDDGKEMNKTFPIKCTRTPDCVFCKLSDTEYAIAKEERKGDDDFEFDSVFGSSLSRNWVGLDCSWILTEEKERPEETEPKIIEVNKTVSDRIEEKVEGRDANGELYLPAGFYQYVLDINKADLPKGERTKYKWFKYTVEVHRDKELSEPDGSIPLTEDEHQQLRDFLADNRYEKFTGLFDDWCEPITVSDQVRSFGDRFNVDLDYEKVIYPR